MFTNITFAYWALPSIYITLERLERSFCLNFFFLFIQKIYTIAQTNNKPYTNQIKKKLTILRTTTRP